MSIELPGIASFRAFKETWTGQASQPKSSPKGAVSPGAEKQQDGNAAGGPKYLEFYEGTGSVRKEQPAARGTHIDVII